MDESLLKNIAYEYPYFADYIEPKGALSIDRASHACFYYGILALRSRETAGSSIDSQIIEYNIHETPEPWMEPRDVEIARGVALMYALNSPDDFLQHRARAWEQARRLGIDIPEEIFTVHPHRKFNT
jgi:hypothetical protein